MPFSRFLHSPTLIAAYEVVLLGFNVPSLPWNEQLARLAYRASVPAVAELCRVGAVRLFPSGDIPVAVSAVLLLLHSSLLSVKVIEIALLECAYG